MPDGQAAEDEGARPAGGVPAVRLDPVGDRHQQQPSAQGEGGVPQPVDLRPPGGGELAQVPVRPHRAEHADRDVDPEHRAPVPGGQHTTEQQPDELAGDAGDLVDAQRHAPLVGRERVGQDGGGVRHQHGAAERLDDAESDQPQGPAGADQRINGQEDRRDREHDKAEVVDLHPAEHVAQPAERHHQDSLDEQVPDDHPQQVADVARRQRVEVDAAEDGRHRDDHDRGVDRRHRHAQGGVGQRDPLVPAVPQPGAAQFAVPGLARVIRPGASGPGVTRLACTSLLFAACRRMPLLSRFPHVSQA